MISYPYQQANQYYAAFRYVKTEDIFANVTIVSVNSKSTHSPLPRYTLGIWLEVSFI